MSNVDPRLPFHYSYSSLYSLAILASLAGCGGSTPAHGSSDATKGDVGQTQPVPSAKPAPSSPSTASTVVAAAEKPSTPPSTSQAVSPFHIVADVDYSFDVQHLGKNTVLLAAGQLLPIRDNTVTFEPKYALTQEILGDGVRGAFQVLLGSFPDALYASVVRPSGRTGLTELYKWTGSKWTSSYSSDESTFVMDIQPWQNGTVLMVETNNFSGEFRFSALPKTTQVFLPEPHGGKWFGASSMCETGFIPDALHTLPSGHAFMTGITCSKNGAPTDSQTAVKRWSPDNKAGTVDVLPDIGNKVFTPIQLVLRNEKDATIGGNTAPLGYGKPSSKAPYLAHFDGKTWTTSTLPFSDEIVSLDVDSNGQLWIVSSTGVLFTRPAGGVWTEVSLPVAGEDRSPITATAVWTPGAGDEWIIGSYKSRSVLLHSGPPSEMAKLPDLETMEDVSTELAMPTPLTWRCSTPFVLLFTLSKVAPPDFDYPATREALKGHTEFDGAQFIEFKRLDKRYMGAFVPGVEMGKKLVDLVKKKVPNSTPQLVCHAPKPLRAIDIDL
jgi:hypothetical protein